MNRSTRVTLGMAGALLLLVPAVLVLTYPGWNDNYYFAVGFTAATYGAALLLAATYPA